MKKLEIGTLLLPWSRQLTRIIDRDVSFFMMKNLSQQLKDTIHNLEYLISTALNQCLKFKHLHIRHAALTLCTKDLSHLILIKLRDLPEPEHTITDPQINQLRPCQSIDETLQSTKMRTQIYMSPPPVERKCLFGSIKNDSVGPSGFGVNLDYVVIDDTMKACDPGYSKLAKEAKLHVKDAFHKMGSLVQQPIQDETILSYPFSFDSITGNSLLNLLPMTSINPSQELQARQDMKASILQ